MFLDIHAHSAAQSIFIYAPTSEDETELIHMQTLPQILENISEYFLFDNCKFANEKSKRNCARIANFRDFGLLDSYTIESSCYGYRVKNSENLEEGIEAVCEQFTPHHFLQFGKELL